MKVHLSANGFELGSELEKYADGKAADLYKEIPRPLRADAVCDIQFTQRTVKRTKISTCTLKLKIGGDEFRAEESTQHMYAALDIAVVHVERQLSDHLARKQSGGRGKGGWQVP